MLLITGLGDWILTGGKLIRCTVDRNITCLQEEERARGGRGVFVMYKNRVRESRIVIPPPPPHHLCAVRR